MKHIVVVFIIVFSLLVSGVLPVSAALYVDDLARMDGSGGKSSYQLTPVAAVGDWSSLPEKSLLGIVSPSQPQGGRIYRLQKASRVEVVVYSSNGIGICRGAEGEYLLGSPSMTEGSPTGLSPFYSPALDGVFLQTGEGFFRAYYDRYKGYFFRPTTQSPGDLIPYGLTVWGSTDGVGYQQLIMTAGAVEYQRVAGLSRENWWGNIPSGITYLKVEINDMGMVPLADGGMQAKTTRTMTLLGKVTLQGEGLIMGAPEPLIEESVLVTPPSSTPEALPPKAEKKATTPKPKTTTEKAASSTKEPAASGESAPLVKFEGSITADPPKKASKGSTAQKATKSTTSSTSKAETQPPTPSEDSEGSPVYYMEPAPETQDSFGIWVKIYVVGITGVILFLLLRPKKE